MLRSGGAKRRLLTLPCQTLAFRAINISSERTGRGERPEGRRGTKQPEGFNRFNLLKVVTINDRYTSENLYIHTCVHQREYSEAEVRQPGTCSSSQECNSSYCTLLRALAQQNAKNGSIKMTARSTHSPRRNKIHRREYPCSIKRFIGNVYKKVAQPRKSRGLRCDRQQWQFPVGFSIFFFFFIHSLSFS